MYSKKSSSKEKCLLAFSLKNLNFYSFFIVSELKQINQVIEDFRYKKFQLLRLIFSFEYCVVKYKQCSSHKRLWSLFFRIKL